MTSAAQATKAPIRVVIADEGPHAGQHLIQNAAERILVAPSVDEIPLRERLLGRLPTFVAVDCSDATSASTDPLTISDSALGVPPNRRTAVAWYCLSWLSEMTSAKPAATSVMAVSSHARSLTSAKSLGRSRPADRLI